MDRAVVVGDTRQHGSLGAGRVFAELQEAGIETFALRKIVRQRGESNPEIVEQRTTAALVAAGRR